MRSETAVVAVLLACIAEPAFAGKAKRLKAVLDEDLPLSFEGDPVARIATVRAVESWVEDAYGK